MPMAIVAVGAAVAGSAVASGIGLVAGTLAFSLVSSVVSLGINMLGSMVLGGGQDKNGNIDNQITDRTFMVKQAITPRRLVYGTVRISGPVVFMETTGGGQYPDEFLQIVVALASHEIQSVENVYFDDRLVWDRVNGIADYLKNPGHEDWARIQVGLGSPNQSANAALAAESQTWTPQHQLRGIAYVYARLRYNPDLWVNGIPNISATVKGKKVYDPRTGLTAYSANAALCIRDYLRDQEYGFAADLSEISDDNFEAYANICDENVSLKGGGTEKRYELHGTVDTSVTPRENFEGMLTAMGARLIYSSGLFYLAGCVYQTPTITYNEDHQRDALRVTTRISQRDRFNTVKGKYASKKDNYVLTDYPPVVSDAYAEADGQEIRKDLNLPFTVSYTMAQRLAKVYLLQSRAQVTVVAPMNLSGLRNRAGDTIMVDNERRGWDGKPFEIMTWVFAQDNDTLALGIDMTWRETAAEIFDWNADEEKDYLESTRTNLPDATAINAPGVSLSDELRVFNNGVVTVLMADVTTDSIFADVIEVQARKSGETEWANMGRASGSRYEMLNVEDKTTYEVRARVISAFGVKSPYTTVSRQIIGKTSPPSDVTNFSLNVLNANIHFSWTAVADLDLAYYKIRWSPLTVGASYANAIDAGEKIAKPATTAVLPAVTGTYFIKAFDTTGNPSLNAAEITTIIERIEDRNDVAVLEEHPDFTGTKDGTIAPDGELILDTAALFDDGVGDFDDGVGLFDGGGLNVLGSGTYTFGPYDLGDKYTSRVTALIEIIRRDYAVLFDDGQGLFDDGSGLFDGDPSSYDDVNAVLYVRVTDDDPSGAPTWSSYRPFISGEFTCRAYEFQLELTTRVPSATPAVQRLSVTIDMPDRTIKGKRISSGTDPGGKVIVFDEPFKELTALGITLLNGQQGDYWVVTAESATGFTVTFHNSVGTIVDRQFNYEAGGFGRYVA